MRRIVISRLLMNEFYILIEEWYRKNGRVLPWRDTRDPYKIWISEIILQQTRVNQGYNYYCRFIRRFPDVCSLAEAEEDEVMRYWQGLGYYSRARNLHAAAKMIVDRGFFPTDYKDILALKGVGDYTAAAIASFAFNQPCAVVDGNVYRVLSRWMGIDKPIDSTTGKKLFASLANELLDKQNPALYNQAIMDFGALQCTPAAPECSICPLVDSCMAYQQHKVTELPVKQHKTKTRNRFFTYFFIHSGDAVFIKKRDEDDIWKNLYELPLIESESDLSEEDLLASEKFISLFEGQKMDWLRLCSKKTKHVLSHQVIWTDFYEVNLVNQTCQLDGYIRVRVEDLYKFPVSRLISRFFSLILKPK